jgi:predicted Zn finger-like uncharacterized protein
VKTRCPQCGTTYDVDPDLLDQAQGLARCFNCGEVFNGRKQALDDETPPGDTPPPQDTPSSDTSEEPAGDPSRIGPAPEDTRLPFEVPEHLPELEPAAQVALDAHDTLHPSARPRTPVWQKLLVLLLTLLLAAQLMWLRRDLWAQLPQASQLCAWLQCVPPRQPRPDLYHVTERSMRALPRTPGALRFELAFRNDADYPQPLPRLQLELLDSNGMLVARRTFSPDQYLSQDWSGPQVALSREVVHITLRLRDPAPRVRGFRINFL